MATMRAAILQQGKHAQILEATQRPQAGPRQLLVAVKACALGGVDVKLQRLFRGKQDDLAVGLEVSGVVEEVGSDIEGFKVGDEVVGLLPPDTIASGCAEYCLFPFYSCVQKPANVSHKDAASMILPGLVAFTALHYLARVVQGDVVLVSQGASPTGIALVQLANHFGAKVIATVSSIRDTVFLKGEPHNATIMDLTEKGARFTEKCLELTEQLGIDVIIDDGALTGNFDADRLKPSKHDIIMALASSGKWVTRVPDLQLDPPDSQTLFMKGATLAYLFEHSWTLSGAQQGRLLHIMEETMTLMASGALRAHLAETITLDAVPETLSQPLPEVGRVVVLFS